jgi:hypothetical protein
MQFDLDGEQPSYTVPPIIRKLRKAEKENPQTLRHIVPLSTQAIAILREVRPSRGVAASYSLAHLASAEICPMVQ